MMHHLRKSLILTAIGLTLSSCGRSPEAVIPPSAEPMSIESSAFEPEGTIPAEFTCNGDDQSPPLTWNTPPSGTQSLVLIMDDPDAPFNTFVHWVVYNIPPTIESLAAGIVDEASLSVGGVQGQNGFKNIGYGGPCPPSGTHRYFFKLYALDTQLELSAGASKAEVIKAMDGHILGAGELMGRYGK